MTCGECLSQSFQVCAAISLRPLTFGECSDQGLRGVTLRTAAFIDLWQCFTDVWKVLRIRAACCHELGGVFSQSVQGRALPYSLQPSRTFSECFNQTCEELQCRAARGDWQTAAFDF
jgi:hypothetical protein